MAAHKRYGSYIHQHRRASRPDYTASSVHVALMRWTRGDIIPSSPSTDDA